MTWVLGLTQEGSYVNFVISCLQRQQPLKKQKLPAFTPPQRKDDMGKGSDATTMPGEGETAEG